MARQTDRKAFPLGELPFAMLVTVMSRTTPQDVARLAVVNRSFAEAARCDLAWRNFLPADVKEVVKNAHGGPLVYGSLNALYDRLVQPVLLGDGNEVSAKTRPVMPSDLSDCLSWQRPGIVKSTKNIRKKFKKKRKEYCQIIHI